MPHQTVHVADVMNSGLLVTDPPNPGIVSSGSFAFDRPVEVTRPNQEEAPAEQECERGRGRKN